MRYFFQIRKAALNALKDEKTLNTAYCIARACDSQQQQKSLINSFENKTANALLNYGTTSKSNANKSHEPIYPSLALSPECIVPKTTDYFATMDIQPVLHDTSQFNFASGI